MPERVYRPWLGVLFMCVACATFPVLNSVVKLLTITYRYEEVVWARVAGHLVLVSAVFLPRRGLALLRTRQPTQQLACSLGLLGATGFFFAAAKYVGVSEAIAIQFLAPLIVVIFAWPILGERLTLWRLASVVVGFAGVLIVIRPGGAVFQWASLSVVGSAISYAIYQIYIRKVSAVDHSSTTVFYSALGCTIVASAFAPFNWRTPDNWSDIALLCSLGFLGAFGHYCLARALSYAPANVIAPFNYTQMIGAVIVGYLMFAEVPDVYTWLGSIVIVAGGLMVGWTSRRVKT
jgi:drug/metabolite transporter (DMT)-like permease